MDVRHADAATVRALLARAKAELAPRALRAYALIVGAAVGDAAAVNCHWQYDAALLNAALGDGDPAFAATPLNPFYRVARGRHSCYGDQLRVVVGSLARTAGALDGDHLRAALVARFTAADYARAADERARNATRVPPAEKKESRPPPERTAL